MDKIKKLTRPFLIGFALSFILFNLTMCPEDTTGPSDPSQPKEETAQLKDFNTRAENAFLTANTDSIIAWTYDNIALEIGKDIKSDPEKLKKFGEAFKSKKILFANEFYAEYEFDVDGEKFTVAMGNSGDGNWKFIRY
jgi:hypothetical protein